MTDDAPAPNRKHQDQTMVYGSRQRLAAAREQMLAARGLLLSATSSFDTQKVVWRQLDPLLAQLAAMDQALARWSA